MPVKEAVVPQEILDTFATFDVPTPPGAPALSDCGHGEAMCQWDAGGKTDFLYIRQSADTYQNNTAEEPTITRDFPIFGTDGIAQTARQLGYLHFQFERPGFFGTVWARPSGRNLIERAEALNTPGQLRLASAGFPKGPELARLIAKEKILPVAVNEADPADAFEHSKAQNSEDHDTKLHGAALVALTKSTFLCDALVERCEGMLSELERAERNWAWRALKRVCKSTEYRTGRQQRALQAMNDFGGSFDYFVVHDTFTTIAATPNCDSLRFQAKGFLPNRNPDDVLNAVRQTITQ